MTDYSTILQLDDFSDKAAKYIYLFIIKYFSQYGSDWDEDRSNLIYLRCIEEISGFRGLFKPKEFPQYLDTIRRCGLSNAPADNENFQTVKRYAILRKLKNDGFDVDCILERDDFHSLTADNVLNLYYEKLDKLSSVSSANHVECWKDNVVAKAINLLSEPEYGIGTPFDFINEHMHGLCKNDLTMIGGVSNSGKGRLLMNILVYACCVEGQSVYLISNEMTSDDMFKAFICTMCNMPAVQALHGQKMKLKQADIVQAKFCDKDGHLINKLDDETAEDYHSRLLVESDEYNKYISVLRWYESECLGCAHFIDAMDDYSTARIKCEIKRAENLGCSIVAYDTLKAYQSSEWGDLVQAATAISEAVKRSDTGIHGIVTFQLTDETNHRRPEDLDSTNIANARHIMHVADNMLMFVHVKKSFYKNYCIEVNRNGKIITGDIAPDKNVTAFKLLKNRRGGGKDDLFGVQINLDLNRWGYLGMLKPAGYKSKCA